MRWPAMLIVLGVGLGAGLAGCNGYNMHPIKDDLQTQVLPAVYCYHNMTESPDCYSTPLDADDARRLMGYYGPDPDTRGYFGRRSF
jgi:hypothetical protein